jgi:phosphopantothenoylcysteine synthetase/decarboxylase
MNYLVTAGPTYEPLDEVRRLTNSSTGKLGSELANFLVGRGHDLTLLLGYYAIYRGEQKAQKVETFTTTAHLSERLQTLAHRPCDAMFHAAAVSDFTFGKVWEGSPGQGWREVKSAKVSTRQGSLWAELVPTPKIISHLREWFPQTRLIGWKYEMDGERSQVISRAEQQLSENRTDACVANGRAYGEGFGLVTGPGKCLHVPDPAALFSALADFVGA